MLLVLSENEESLIRSIIDPNRQQWSTFICQDTTLNDKIEGRHTNGFLIFPYPNRWSTFRLAHSLIAARVRSWHDAPNVWRRNCTFVVPLEITICPSRHLAKTSLSIGHVGKLTISHKPQSWASFPFHECSRSHPSGFRSTSTLGCLSILEELKASPSRHISVYYSFHMQGVANCMQQKFRPACLIPRNSAR